MKIIQKQTGRLASMLGHRLNVINKIMTTNPHTEEINTECCVNCKNTGHGSDPYEFGEFAWYCNNKGCPCHQKPMNTECCEKCEEPEEELFEGHWITTGKMTCGNKKCECHLNKHISNK